ncbi:ClC family H(+)/Cl(-) exchange transporter, partial [Escherichia coli]|nr:ClC family H(+)/Cl(-) exchange transporter [Escherichia coli]
MSQVNSASKSMIKSRLRIFKRLKESDKTPVKILLLAALIGAAVGLIGSLFEIGTTWISNYRVQSVSEWVAPKWLMVVG